MMGEAKAVAEALGVSFKISLEQRLAGAEAVGAHKTSMLQDVEHGRALELEALVGAVVELGQVTGTPTPTIEAIYAATSLLARTLQAQGGPLGGAGRLTLSRRQPPETQDQPCFWAGKSCLQASAWPLRATKPARCCARRALWPMWSTAPAPARHAAALQRCA
jgi:hypothetical protein